MDKPLLLDTNIILDILEKRIPHHQASENLLSFCVEKDIGMYLAWHSIATVFYLLRKKLSPEVALAKIQSLNQIIPIAPVGQSDFERACTYGIADLEDAMICASAESIQASMIITRDSVGFNRSPIATISPEEFLEQ